MFQDLDTTLAGLVRAELSLPDITISFVSPDDQFPPSGVTLPAVVFFLYDVRENADLRTNQWEDERLPNGVITRKRPPVRVDCSYLITAWPSETAPNAVQDEHRLLGEVMKVLLRHRRIPERHLYGELAGQEPPVPARITADSQLQSVGEFWQAMGGRPKATLQYRITISVDVFDATEVAPEVTSKVIQVTQAQPAGQ
jgi:Pvc16 N-terminal domain